MHFLRSDGIDFFVRGNFIVRLLKVKYALRIRVKFETMTLSGAKFKNKMRPKALHL